MAYDSSTDLSAIQRDVLTTDVSANSLISKVKQLKTSQKTIIKALNDISSKLDQAIEKANTANTDAAETKKLVSSSGAGSAQTATAPSITLQNDEFVCADSQTEFVLSKTPKDANNILFLVNGVKYARSDFSYNASSNKATWTGIKDENHPRGFSLAHTDVVSIVYLVEA